MKSFGFSREDAQMGTDGGRKLKKHLADAGRFAWRMAVELSSTV